MPAPKGNKNAKGNKGGPGAPTDYRPEYCEEARILCAECGFTDARLAEHFGVTERTINNWKLRCIEFRSALTMGKAETDDYVERCVVKGISGYFVEHQETVMIRGEPTVKTVRKWVPGNPGVGMRWLAARRPEIYREIKEDKLTLSADEAFMKALEAMNERVALRRSERAKLVNPKLIEHEHEPI